MGAGNRLIRINEIIDFYPKKSPEEENIERANLMAMTEAEFNEHYNYYMNEDYSPEEPKRSKPLPLP